LKQLGLSRDKRIRIAAKYRGRIRYKYSVGNDLIRMCGEGTNRGHFRIAVGASKGCGAAVVRNRLKRMGREVLRIHQGILAPKTDYLLIFTPVSPKKKSDKSIVYKNLRFADLETMILGLLDRLKAKMASQG
jgi:ribonuclease P protein component